MVRIIPEMEMDFFAQFENYHDEGRDESLYIKQTKVFDALLRKFGEDVENWIFGL